MKIFTILSIDFPIDPTSSGTYFGNVLDQSWYSGYVPWLVALLLALAAEYYYYYYLDHPRKNDINNWSFYTMLYPAIAEFIIDIIIVSFILLNIGENVFSYLLSILIHSFQMAIIATVFSVLLIFVIKPFSINARHTPWQCLFKN